MKLLLYACLAYIGFRAGVRIWPVLIRTVFSLCGTAGAKPDTFDATMGLTRKNTRVVFLTAGAWFSFFAGIAVLLCYVTAGPGGWFAFFLGLALTSCLVVANRVSALRRLEEALAPKPETRATDQTTSELSPPERIDLSTYSNWRVPVGFAVAPLIPCALLNEIARVLFGQPWGESSAFLGLVGLSYLVTLAIPIPLYVLFRHYWRMSLGNCLVNGAAIAAVLTASVLLVGAYSTGRLLEITLVLTLVGAGWGFCFWVTVVWKNPHFTYDR